jgi:protein arginine N-methyltransferase 1
VISQLDEHLGYVSDPLRLALFEKAVASTVRPGDVVVDLGCGTGILGLLCLKAGASRTYEIDSSAMITVAQESFARAGLGERAVFLHGKAHQVELPERADVVVCDQVGYFGFDYDIVHSLRDARRRFLKPGGKLIPSRIRLRLAAIESDACRALADGWTAAAVPAEFHWVRQHAVNTKHGAAAQRGDVLGAPAELGVLDLREDGHDFHSWTVSLPIERDGVLHGLAGWFECELADGMWMTNSPLADAAIKRALAFLPIGEPVAVKAGDVVKANVMTRPDDHLIAWRVALPARGVAYSHSTWLGDLYSPADIARRDPGHVPKPTRTGQARICVLGYCDGKRTGREIEQLVLREHPDLLPSAEEISRFVAQVLDEDAA